MLEYGETTCWEYGIFANEEHKVGELPAVNPDGVAIYGWESDGIYIHKDTRISGYDSYRVLSAIYENGVSSTKPVNVVFYKDGKEVESFSRNPGDEIGRFPDIDHAGNTFLGWSTSPGYLFESGFSDGFFVEECDVVAPNSNSGDSLFLYARYEKPFIPTKVKTAIPPKLKCVAFYRNYDDQTIDVKADGSIEIFHREFVFREAFSSKEELVSLCEMYAISCREERDGYVFTGWYTSRSGGERVDKLPATAFSADIALFAHWERLDGGAEEFPVVDVQDDTDYYIPIIPEGDAMDDERISLTIDGVSVTSRDNPLKEFLIDCTTNLVVGTDSVSGVKVKVVGLPTGMKFDAKANVIRGTPTKPGVYKVSVSLVNEFTKNAVVNNFAIVVPILKDERIPVKAEYGAFIPGIAYTNTIVAAAGCTVSGLPAGMKWTAKDILDSKTKEVSVLANSVYGAPTKPGKYTVYFTKTVDKVKHTATAIFIVGDYPIVKVVTVGSGTGKVTGAGAFAANKKVTLKATVDTKDDEKKSTKKSVFAGWYLDANGLNPVESTVDFRTASLPYVMTADSTTTLYAMFVTAEEDSDIALYVNGNEITSNVNDNNFVAGGTTILPLQMDSISVPKAAVSGLPAGMKFANKAFAVKATKTEDAYEVPANSIYGTPTKPGFYTVTVKLTNTTVKKAIEKKFTIEVPNLTGANSYFVDNLNNGVGKKCVLSVGITNIYDFLPSFKLKTNSTKLAVKGLPPGLKYDAKTGKITGIAAKPGLYTVYLTVTEGKNKYVSTITVDVQPLPDWVVGTFEGYAYVEVGDGGDYHDRIIYTISSTGKVSSKGQVEDTTWYTIKDNILTKNDDETYQITSFEQEWDFEENRSLRIIPCNIGGVVVGRLSGTIVGAEYEEWCDSWENSNGNIDAIQNVWKNAQGTKLAPTFIKNTITYVSMSRMRDDDWDPYYGGYLTLKYGANGAVTTAYSETEGGKATAIGSAQLVPYEVDGNITKAWLYTALKPKGRDAFGVLLFLSIDTSNGNVYGDDVTVEDYLLEVDE